MSLPETWFAFLMAGFARSISVGTDIKIKTASTGLAIFADVDLRGAPKVHRNLSLLDNKPRSTDA